MHRDGEDEEGEEEIPWHVKAKSLEHPTRKGIMELLEQRPGLNMHRIGVELGLNPSVLKHHIEELEEKQLITRQPSEREGEKICFRVEDVDLWEMESTRILFGQGQTRKVALFIAEHPGATTREIAEAMGISPVTVAYHAKTLMRYDLVDRYPAGQTLLYEANEVLERWVIDVGKGFKRPWDGEDPVG